MQKVESNNLQSLDAIDIFSPDHLHANHGKCLERRFRKAETIYRKGDHNAYLYFILNGRVKICLQGDGEKEIIKAVIEEGEVFGEMALVNDGPRTDCAVALDSTRLYMLNKKNIDLSKESNGMQNYLLRLLGKRIMEVENRLQSLVFKDSRTRIINFLLRLVEKKGERIGYEVVVRKFLTHQEIAYLTATSRQTVTTVLNDLRGMEMIKFDRRRLLIRDKARLVQEGS